MGAGHTPGPWDATNHFADDTTRCNCAYVLSGGYAGAICKVYFDNGLSIADGGNDCPPREEAAANARLIAAAPDMLAALQHILDGALSLPRFAEDEARAAIARATGAA